MRLVAIGGDLYRFIKEPDLEIIENETVGNGSVKSVDKKISDFFLEFVKEEDSSEVNKDKVDI